MKYTLQWNVVFLIFLSSCATMSLYDHFSYKETISAKVEALALMDKATGNFQDYSTEIEELKKSVQKIYEYEKNRPKNVETAKMWEILFDPNKKLLGGFLKKWETDSTLSEAFIDQAKIQVEKAFDIIIDLESKKIKPEEANSFINNN